MESLIQHPSDSYAPSVEGRRLFHRNASGKVDYIIDCRNNDDMLWKKVK